MLLVVRPILVFSTKLPIVAIVGVSRKMLGCEQQEERSREKIANQTLNQRVQGSSPCAPTIDKRLIFISNCVLSHCAVDLPPCTNSAGGKHLVSTRH